MRTCKSKPKHCKTCNKVLRHWNESGYCNSCLRKSPKYKSKRKEYYLRPEVRIRYNLYQKIYQQTYYKPRLNRPCIRCNKKFSPTGKFVKICDKCNIKYLRGKK